LAQMPAFCSYTIVPVPGPPLSPPVVVGGGGHNGLVAACYLAKAGYPSNPLTDGSLAAFTVYPVPMTSLTLKACEPTGAKPRDAERSKNFFALGLVTWLYGRPVEKTLEWIGDGVRCGEAPGPAARSARRCASPPRRPTPR